MKPVLVYDGDCGFCKVWIARWQSVTKGEIDYAPFQEVQGQFPKISPEEFKNSIQLIEPSGKVSHGAEAVFRALASVPSKKWMLWAYEKIPGVQPVSELFYRLVAENRSVFSFLTNLLWGKTVEPPNFLRACSLFLRFLGVIYLIAFTSLWVQLKGLIGSNGILPAHAFLETVHGQLGNSSYWWAPTLFWLDSSDLALQLINAAGILFSVFLIIGFLPSFSLFLLWLFYLSFVTVGRDFLSFQWDALLLETGFLAIFLTPATFFIKNLRTIKPSRFILFLFRWLLFRLTFSSGLVKLASGDPTWKNLTALTVHYETQPLPTWIGWYAHQLPVWFQKFSTLSMFAIEIVIPFLFFAPRRLRQFACATTIFLQLLIMLTGNYCFFNILTITLCLFLIEDNAFYLSKKKESSVEIPQQSFKSHWFVKTIGTLLFLLSLVPMARLVFEVKLTKPLTQLYQILSPFDLVNHYGLFAVMTTERIEIVVEGSDDNVAWLPYEFKYKPGDVKRKPTFVEPHQPRLDWQMWFAALGTYQQNPWFINFCIRLLEGSLEVLSLLEKNPFPNKPPRFIRAVKYRYHFSHFDTKKKEGAWWTREYVGSYLPILSLK